MIYARCGPALHRERGCEVCFCMVKCGSREIPQGSGFTADGFPPARGGDDDDINGNAFVVDVDCQSHRFIAQAVKYHF